MREKNDFDNIFKKLKNPKRASKKAGASKDNSKTREIVVKWYIMIFNNFDTDLIDQNQDIYETEIHSIDFHNPEILQLQIDMVCMLSVKNEDQFRSNMKTLIQRFHNEKNKINHEKLN